MRRLRRHRQLLLWSVFTALLLAAAHSIYYAAKRSGEGDPIERLGRAFLLSIQLVDILIQNAAVLLLNLRPRRMANRTNTPFGRRSLSAAKVILAIWLAYQSFLGRFYMAYMAPTFIDDFRISFTMLVLSHGSLQTPANGRFGCWVDAILHVFFLSDLLLSHTLLSTSMAFISILAVLLSTNLQIPVAAVQVVLSSWHLFRLLAHQVFPQKTIPNMVPSLALFYVMALCQGALYVKACILDLFSVFLHRPLIRWSGLRGQWGANAANLYYQRAYRALVESGVLSAGNMISLASFATEALSSSSRELQLVGVCVLDSLLQPRNYSEELVLRLIRSKETMPILVSMMDSTFEQDRDIRLFAARVTSELAGSLKIVWIPGMMKSVSSLLDAKGQQLQTLVSDDDGGRNVDDSQLRQRSSDHTRNERRRQDIFSKATSVSGENVVNQPLGKESSTQTTYVYGEDAVTSSTVDRSEHGERNNGACCWICPHWLTIKEKWSIPEEPPFTHQDSLPGLGMLILKRLTFDLDNCAEISRSADLIFKIISFICYTTDKSTGNDIQQENMTSSALNLVRRLAITGGKIGAALRQELWKDPFLLNKLICILDDSQINLEVWEQVIDIIAKLALDEDARQEIGSSQIVIAKLMHVFIGPYDQSLANLAMDSNANCSAILEETEYDLIKNLKDMLCNDEYRYVAANLLQNLCGHARDELSPPGARGHLRSALPVVIENIKDGQLEALIGLVSRISYVIPEWFVHELESNNNGAGLVTKLVDTLNSNTKPSPEYPRMRRVVIEVVISIVTSCPRYGIIFREQGMVDAPSKVVRYPSEVERYRVFLGNEGVVVERGLPLRDLVNRAKGLIDPATEIPVAQLGDHS